jgi:hypothetical protein
MIPSMLPPLCRVYAAVVGTSMGCAVIWSYVELFGTARLRQAMFVDQVCLSGGGGQGSGGRGRGRWSFADGTEREVGVGKGKRTGVRGQQELLFVRHVCDTVRVVLCDRAPVPAACATGASIGKTARDWSIGSKGCCAVRFCNCTCCVFACITGAPAKLASQTGACPSWVALHCQAAVCSLKSSYAQQHLFLFLRLCVPGASAKQSPRLVPR